VSATVLTQDFDVTTSALDLVHAVANWLCEQDCFTSVTQNSNGDTIRWENESCGINLYNYIKGTNKLVYCSATTSLTSPSASGGYTTYSEETDGETGQKHYKISAILAMTDNVVLVMLRNGVDTGRAATFLKITSADLGELRGFASANLSSTYSGTYRVDYVTNVLLKKPEDAALSNTYITSLVCDRKAEDPEGKLILTPYYALVPNIQMAPVLIPGLYAEAGSSFPTLQTQFTAGTKTMLQVSDRMALDIT
jgi:hypothetical protein